MPNLYIIAGFKITLLYFWLLSPEFAKQRVAIRVSKGGHNIPSDVIERRYYKGIYNLLNLYLPIVDRWMVIDNMNLTADIIAKGTGKEEKTILNSKLWDIISKQSSTHDK